MGFELQSLWQETRKTIVLVTHSIAEAVMLSDRVIAITARPGQIDSVSLISLPRPRTAATLEHPNFLQSCRVLRNPMYAASVAAMCPRHVGRCPSLIDEDVAIPVEIALALAPGFAPRHNIRAVLFRGMGGLFSRDLVALEEAADRAIAKGQALFAQAITEFLDSEVGVASSRAIIVA